MRLFVALPLPGDLIRALARVREALRSDGEAAGARFTRPEGIHLTLRFLGETEAGRLEEVATAFAAAVAGTGALSLRASGIGFFPDPRRPRVIWVGVEGEDARLQALALRCEEEARRLCFAPEARPFRPHLTLARVEGRSAGQGSHERLVAAAARLDTRELASWLAATACLFESVLRPGGALYTVRRELPLT